MALRVLAEPEQRHAGPASVRNADTINGPVVMYVGLHCRFPEYAVVLSGGLDSEEVRVL